MDKYEELDAAIVAYITKHAPCRFHDIWQAVDAEAVKAKPGNGYRAVDGRLQSLRRRGLIRSVGQSWIVAGSE